MKTLSRREGPPRRGIAHSMVVALAAGVLACGGALALAVTPAGATTPTAPFTQCPPTGDDTMGCGILIVLSDSGAQVLTDPSQGPYDGDDDTLIGVLNNTTSTTVTSVPLTSVPVSGMSPVFAFDGDGICDNPNSTSGLAGADCTGNTMDHSVCINGPSTGPCYGGPDSYFTNVNGAETSGTVNFITPLAPGQSTFFSLEGAINGSDINIVSGTASPISAVEGISFSGTVANFSSSDTTTLASRYSASIDWGDAMTSLGTVNQTGPGQFSVTGTHTYAEENDASQATVTITDTTNGNTTTVQSPVTVADAPLTAGTLTLTGGVEGVSLGSASFTFVDANLGATIEDFLPVSAGGNGGSVTINWGDGTGPVEEVPLGFGAGIFGVLDNHQYTEEGTYTVTVNVADDGGSTTSATGTVTVGDAPLTAGTLTLTGGVEGVSPGSASFTFTDANPGATTADFTSGGGSTTINWGDGTTTTESVSGLTGGPFTVADNHQYAEEGTYTVTVNVADDGGSTTSATGTNTVSDAPLAATGSPAFVSTNPVSHTVGTFTDQNLGATTADFTSGGGSTTINWGDASTSAGTVTQTGPGQFTVSGTHTYGALGPYTITTTIVDDGGSTATAVTHVIVFAFPTGGDFVIGNENSALGTTVTFWGAQWDKSDSLSGGPAPASFKGFEDSAVPPTCGTSWTTDPGNSTPPPSGPLPTYMGVIVSSSITKSGSAISGNTPDIVVVMTNSGYAPDPGHAGTGTVAATVC